MSIALTLPILTVTLVGGLAAVTLNDGQRSASPSNRPNFSGVWTEIPPEAPEPARNPDELVAMIDWSSPTTLTQDDATLTVEYRGNDRSHALRKFVYRLDGSTTSNVLTGSVNPQGRSSTAAWEGATLVLTDLVDWPNRLAGTTQKRLDRRALSLESPDVLRVEASLRLGGRSSPTKLVRFRRTR
jgi:hypothetical protein